MHAGGQGFAVLSEYTAGMPGCFSYVVARDAADENIVWVTGIWDSMASPDASLKLPAVLEGIACAKPMIAGFERIAVTEPVGGVGLPATLMRYGLYGIGSYGCAPFSVS